MPKTENKGEFRNKKGDFVLEMSFEGRLKHKNGESVPKTENKGEFRNKKGDFVLEMSFEGRFRHKNGQSVPKTENKGKYRHKTRDFVLGMRLPPLLSPPPLSPPLYALREEGFRRCAQTWTQKVLKRLSGYTMRCFQAFARQRR